MLSKQLPVYHQLRMVHKKLLLLLLLLFINIIYYYFVMKFLAIVMGKVWIVVTKVNSCLISL